MKTKWMHLIAGFTMFVLCISICTTTTDATVLWSDDFESGLGDWTIFGYENDTSDVKIEGNFSAASGILEVLDDGINFARHNSTVNVGTWSFDMFVPDVEDVRGAMYVYIMSNGSRPIPTYPSDFIAVGAWRQNELSTWHFIVWTMNGLDWIIHSQIYKDPMQGWHHIDISRTSDGHFYVYFNGTFEDAFTYNDVAISTYLEFYCYSATGAAIDNLVVRDDITTTTPTTTPLTTTPPTTPIPTPLPLELILIGGSVAAVVIVLAIVFLRRR